MEAGDGDGGGGGVDVRVRQSLWSCGGADDLAGFDALASEAEEESFED